jgi:hypothetical protein
VHLAASRAGFDHNDTVSEREIIRGIVTIVEADVDNKVVAGHELLTFGGRPAITRIVTNPFAVSPP